MIEKEEIHLNDQIGQMLDKIDLNQQYLSKNLKQLNPFQQIKIHSEAYPDVTLEDYCDKQIQKLNNPTKKILKPQIRSDVHQKLKKINFDQKNYEQPILIRQYQLKDIPQLRKLQDQWFPVKYGEQFYKRIIRKQVYCIIAQTTITIEQKINQKDQPTEQTIIVGAAVFQITDSQGYAQKSWMKSLWEIFSSVQDSIYIMTLGVIDQFRKKGVGKMLIQQILDISNQQKNIKLIYLHVIAYNKAALNFYKKIGFDQLQYINNFYHLAGKEYDGQAYGIFVNQGKPNRSWTNWFKKILR